MLRFHDSQVCFAFENRKRITTFAAVAASAAVAAAAAAKGKQEGRRVREERECCGQFSPNCLRDSCKRETMIRKQRHTLSLTAVCFPQPFSLSLSLQRKETKGRRESQKEQKRVPVSWRERERRSVSLTKSLSLIQSNSLSDSRFTAATATAAAARLEPHFLLTISSSDAAPPPPLFPLPSLLPLSLTHSLHPAPVCVWLLTRWTDA